MGSPSTAGESLNHTTAKREKTRGFSQFRERANAHLCRSRIAATGWGRPQNSKSPANPTPTAHELPAGFEKSARPPPASPRVPPAAKPAPEPYDQPRVSTSFGPSPRVLLGAVCRRGTASDQGNTRFLATGPPEIVRGGTPLRAAEENDSFDRRAGWVLLESLFLPRTPEPFDVHTVFLSSTCPPGLGPSFFPFRLLLFSNSPY